MAAIETATFAIGRRQTEAADTVRGNSLYLDPSLLQRKDFMRYLVALILHEYRERCLP